MIIYNFKLLSTLTKQILMGVKYESRTIDYLNGVLGDPLQHQVLQQKVLQQVLPALLL